MYEKIVFPVISIIIALIALFFSIISFRKSNQIQKKFLNIEENRDHGEKKAILTANLEGNELIISNISSNEARNVVVLLDGKPVNEHKDYLRGGPRENPIPFITSDILYYMDRSTGAEPRWEINISWDDDFSTQREYRDEIIPK